MPYCMQCGKENPEGDAFCPACGAIQAAHSAGAASVTAAAADDLRVFVGPGAGYYLPRFARFSVAGIDNFAVTWNWPAAFVPLFWMLYRKMYLWALAVFVSHCIPVFNLIALLVWPMVANYLYYKHARGKVAEVRAANPGVDVAAPLAEVGGVNRWVWPLAIILIAFGLILLAVLGLIGCLAFIGSGHCGGAGGFVNG
jgi:hypothetical protein